MPWTNEFVASPNRFVRKKVMIVNENAITGVKPVAGAGVYQLLAGANYVFDWTVGPGVGGAAELVIHQAAQVGRQRAYFLPYEPDAAIALDIPAIPIPGVDYFFTSTLSGCMVVVERKSTGALTVTHANARDTYARIYKPIKDDDDSTAFQLRQADRRATTAAIATMQSTMPYPSAGSTVRQVTKNQYIGDKVTDKNVKKAQSQIPLREGEKVKTLVAVREKQQGVEKDGGKPMGGAFVYGIRNATTGWSFWYQSAVSVAGKAERGIFNKKERFLMTQDVVLGRPEQFYP